MAQNQTNSYKMKRSNKSGKCCTLGKIFIFIIVEVIVILLTAAIVFIFLNRGNEPYRKKSSHKVHSNYTFEKFLDYSFSATYFNGSWISDDEIFMMNSNGQYVVYNVANGAEKIILANKTLIDKADNVLLSADQKYLLITYDKRKLFRWSVKFFALIYNTETQTQSVIQNTNKNQQTLQLFQWAPRGNGFAYISSNNIYFHPDALLSEEYQITYDGNGTISNGICDWVYEEEIFGASPALWFAPDGSKLIYAKFNDGQTDTMTAAHYGKIGNLNHQYPETHFIRYPKVGRNNPSVQLFVVDLNENTNTSTKEKSQREIQFLEQYPQQILTSVSWINVTEISLMVMNRVQNKATILSCNSHSGDCEKILYLKNEKGWVDIMNPKFSDDGQNILYIYSWDQGNDLGGYQHLTLYNVAENRSIALTKGKYTVTKIIAWDKNNDIVYYQATEENKSMNQQVYKIAINEVAQMKPECLSCATGSNCHYANAKFSKKQSYYVKTCLGPSVPHVTIYDKNNTEILLWETNDVLQTNLENISLPQIEFLKFKVESDVEVNVKLLIPPNIDKSGSTKYPLLVHVYGGPNYNEVYSTFKIDWNSFYSSNYEAVIAFIDGRGSGRNGDKFLYANYRNLGTLEIEDQINVSQQIQEMFPFIDKTRTGIWGWSYGGYVAGMVLAKDSRNIFKCGVSIAPVTDWIYYDSMYTERYMGLPTENDNLAGYNASSLVRMAEKLNGKKYLLVHGTYDDNVHLQHSMMLARSLELHNIKFSQMVYPDEDHSLAGVRNHLYNNLELFFNECFA